MFRQPCGCLRQWLVQNKLLKRLALSFKLLASEVHGQIQHGVVCALARYTLVPALP